MNFATIKNILIPKKVLDIGAHIGEFYSSVNYNFPDASCLLIEANPDCEVYLKSLNVPYHICLLGNENKKVTFFKNKKNPICTGSSMFKELSEHYNEENLEQVTLDCHRLDDLNKNKIVFDLVKIDTQGAELEIFKGGIETLTKAKFIIMETSVVPYNNGAPMQKEVIEFMAKYNFENIEVVSEGRANGGLGELLQQDILFLNKSI